MRRIMAQFRTERIKIEAPFTWSGARQHVPEAD